MELLIIIPAYNEQDSIEAVVDNLVQNFPQYDYVVVNDGSTDNTAEICKENNYNMLDLPVNLGLSGAVRAGIKYAKKQHYKYALQFDADGQHKPEFIADMLSEMKNSKVDIVIGSRFLTVKKPKTLRMVGSYIISWAIRLTTGVAICDPTSGMRLYDERMIKEFSLDSNYTPEPDTISYLLRNGASIKEVQVEMDERIAGESYLTMSRSMVYMIRMGMSIAVIQWFRKRNKQ